MNPTPFPTAMFTGSVARITTRTTIKARKTMPAGFVKSLTSL